MKDHSGPEAPEVGAAGDGRAILAIGIDPSGREFGFGSARLEIAGEIFRSLLGEGNSGSPGGRPGGVAGGGGSGGNGRAGDESVGLGPGKEGGGGGKDGSSGRLSIKGTGNGVPGSVAMLDPHLEAKMIYPVGPLRARHSGRIKWSYPRGPWAEADWACTERCLAQKFIRFFCP